MPILTGTLLDVNPRTVFNDWLWKLGWLTKLEKDSLQQTSSNTTQLKKRPTGSPTDQTEQTKLANERYSSLRATTHFTAKLTNQSNQRWNVWLRDNSSLDSADFCLGQSLVTTTALFQDYYYPGDRTTRLTSTRYQEIKLVKNILIQLKINSRHELYQIGKLTNFVKKLKYSFFMQEARIYWSAILIRNITLDHAVTEVGSFRLEVRYVLKH